jgi:hypothetical protein
MKEMGGLRALVIAVAVVVGTAVPAAAQTLPTTPETTPESTTTTPDSTLPPETTPDSTVPGDPTPPTTPPIIDDPGINGDAPPESVPQIDATIPAATVPPGAPESALPPRARVVQIDVQTARASALLRMAAYNGAVARRQELEASAAEMQLELSRLDGKSRDAVRKLTEAHEDLVERAVYAYVRGGDEAKLWTGTDDTSGQRTALLSAVADRDQTVIERYQDAKAQVTRDEAKKVQDLAATQAELALTRVGEAQAQADLNSAQLELAVTTAGGNIVIHGFVFPVASPHSFNEDFGAPRLPGTAQAHSHEGCDVAAAEGTVIFSEELGLVMQFRYLLLFGL